MPTLRTLKRQHLTGAVCVPHADITWSFGKQKLCIGLRPVPRSKNVRMWSRSSEGSNSQRLCPQVCGPFDTPSLL